MSHVMRKPRNDVCAQRRLRSAWAFAQSGQSSLWTQWVTKEPRLLSRTAKTLIRLGGERGGSVVECRTPEREVGGSRPTAAVLCPWARHFTPRKYWLITQEAVAPSRHDWKIVDWDVKPQHKQTIIRLGGCPNWSESSLGAHVILFLSCCGSNMVGYLNQNDTRIHYSDTRF